MRRFLAATACAALLGCGGEDPTATTDPTDTEPVVDAVTVDTTSPLARAQYDATAQFAGTYRARCGGPAPAGGAGRPRVLVTGFGRFLTNRTNATGMIVNALVPAAQYPMTEPPAPGQVDLPGPQTSVGRALVRLPRAGLVDVCAMILPVQWDLAAVLALKEVEAFGPAMVVMNGIAGSEQPLWIELGGVNRAMTLEDGSGLLAPRPPPGQRFAPIVPSASAADLLRGAVLSWEPVREAARAAVRARGDVLEDGRRFDQVLQGALLGGFPRDGNTYLCNNLSYAVSYAMAYPSRTITLLQASTTRRGVINRVPVRVTRDLRTTPRVFLHWPSTLRGAHLVAAADVLSSVIDAQLMDRAPRAGDNRLAEISPTGMTF